MGERLNAALGVLQGSRQQSAGQEEGGRLSAASGEEALEPGEVRGQRGTAALQRRGVILERVALRATRLKQRVN